MWVDLIDGRTIGVPLAACSTQRSKNAALLPNRPFTVNVDRQGRPRMNDQIGNRPLSRKPPNGDNEQTLSPRAILLILTAIALACVGGYFLLMKLIDVSRQEDCLLAGRRNCAAIEVPANR